MTSDTPRTPSWAPRRPRRVTTNLRRGLNLAWTASPRAFVGFAVLGVINAAVPSVVVLLGALLVNRIADSRVHPLRLSDLVPILLGLLVATCVRRATSGYLTYGQNLFVRRVQFEAERRLLTHASRVDLGHFDSSDWHDRLARANRDVSWRPGALAWLILQFSGLLVGVVFMSSVLATLDYWLVGLALGAAALSLWIDSGITPRLHAALYKEIPGDRERNYIGDLLVNPRNTKEIRAFVLARHLLDRHRRLSERLLEQRAEMYRPAVRRSILCGAVQAVSVVAAFTFVAVRGIEGTIDPGGVMLVLTAFTSVVGTLGQIATTYLTIDQHTAFLDDYFSFLAIEPLLAIPDEPRTLPARLTEGITFAHVTFTYPRGRAHAVEDLNLHIRSGELLAIVGDNGAGKSTVVKLLLRFYDPDHGSIRVGGIDIRELEPESLRRRIGVLFQDYANYELTIRDNVALGRCDAPVEDARVLKALTTSRSASMLKEMPDGLDTRVGRLFEGGRDLSGGEWQRLALARIMYRNADIWILDEPTSAVDAETEAMLFAELKAHLRGRIGIVISHRFSTVRIADRIAIISDGRICELGTHEELLAAQGRYAALFELQAVGYR